jgi:hypothetical protein
MACYEYLTTDDDGHWTVKIDGEDIYNNFNEVFDEMDMFMLSHKKSCAYRRIRSPRVKIRAVRRWWFAESSPRYDTIPDDVIESICDGISPDIFVFDFTELFMVRKNTGKKMNDISDAKVVEGKP